MLLLAPTHNQMLTCMGIARSGVTAVTTAAAMTRMGIARSGATTAVTTAAAMDGESAEAIMALIGEGGRATGVVSTGPAGSNPMTTAQAGAANVGCVGSSE